MAQLEGAAVGKGAPASNIVLFSVAGLCIALNVGLGGAAYLTRLPIYLDAVGTIAFALLSGALGWRGFALSALIGAISFLLTGLLLNPVVIWFIPTQVTIAAFAFYVARPILGGAPAERTTSRVPSGRIVLLGLGLGVVTSLVSAPIIALVFGGVTGSGASIITALLLRSGQTLYQSVLASGLASEPFDKLLQVMAAVAMARATPSRIRRLLAPGA